MNSSNGKKDRSINARTLLVFFCIFGGMGLLWIFQSGQKRQAVKNGPTGKVTFVYDGDTLQLDGTKKVRLIGVDTLDSHNKNKLNRQAAWLAMQQKHVKYWAKEATKKLQDWTSGRTVRLEFGPQRRDDYGRTLAYIFVKRGKHEIFVNRKLIREGLGTATRKWKHPYRKTFIELEQQAHREQRGLWNDAGQKR